jgi:hypothetical protein
LIPSKTRGRAWNNELSYIPKNTLDSQPLMTKFDALYSKYLSPPNHDLPKMDFNFKAARLNNKMNEHPATIYKSEKDLKKHKEAFRTRVVNIIMFDWVNQRQSSSSQDEKEKEQDDAQLIEKEQLVI